ncbi:unnamed protein product [Urochloa humidicola]
MPRRSGARGSLLRSGLGLAPSDERPNSSMIAAAAAPLLYPLRPPCSISPRAPPARREQEAVGSGCAGPAPRRSITDCFFSPICGVTGVLPYFTASLSALRCRGFLRH